MILKNCSFNNSPIKVAIINTYPTGGASVAKNRLVKSLSNHSECEIDLLERSKSDGREVLDTLECDSDQQRYDHILAKYQRYLIHNNRTKVTNTLFSGESSSWDFSEHPIILDADVINLHWIAEFIGTESLKKLAKLGKPLVWTLHDERAFTGGCHYTFGCMKYSYTCSECPQINEYLSWLPKHNFEISKQTS